MSAPVDVLAAYIDGKAGKAGAIIALSAVAELVEAVRNYRDNCARLKADYPGDDPFPRTELDRHQFLKGQMFAAVDRFGGAV
jgi:hypothetical protein